MTADELTETIPLWLGDAPGGPGPAGHELVSADGAHSLIRLPRMVMRRPMRATGAAVLILGGGGYSTIGIGRESEPIARWLTARGVTTFVLFYRLPNAGWPRGAPFQDAQRAMRLLRAHAETFEIDPNRIGILGFSAGGHLAGVTATRPDATLYRAADAVDQASARPDFAALIYPVLTLIPPHVTRVTTQMLLGPAPTMAQREALSVERLVSSTTPPCFLVHAADDPIAPVENCLLAFAALRHAGVSAAMHIFESGRHGFGLGKPGTPASAWPQLFAEWAGLA